MTRPIRIVRVIARMNVGGPAVEVANLMRKLPSDKFTQVLLTGFVASDEEDYLEMQGTDIHAQRIPGLGRAVSVADDIRAFIAIRRIVKASRPAVVHTHTAKAGALGRIAAYSVHPRPKIVHTFHGHVLSGYFSKTANFAIALIERILALLTDELIAVGPEVRDALLDAGVGDAARFAVIEPGVSLRRTPTKVEARELLGLGQSVPVISVVGRITHIKRPDRMLDVIRLLQGDLPELQVLVAGDGDLREETERRASAEGLPVRFIGWTDDVETVFAASDVTLLTSDNEGTPISLMQAALLDVPAVATDVGSVRHVVIDGETGWLAPPQAVLLATAIREALSSRAELARRGQSAHRHASKAFSVDRFVEDHAQLYKRVVGR